MQRSLYVYAYWICKSLDCSDLMFGKVVWFVNHTLDVSKHFEGLEKHAYILSTCASPEPIMLHNLPKPLYNILSNYHTLLMAIKL